LEVATESFQRLFKKLCKEPNLKKPTQINNIKKKLLLLLQPTPALVATINPAKLPQNRKTAKPHNINVNTVKNDTQPTQNQKNPTQKPFHPRLNTQ
jgi:hypothetical protein